MLLIAKLFLSSLLKRIYTAISFIIEHWRIFLPLVIVVITLLYINGLKRDIASLEKVIADNQAQIEKDAQLARQKEQIALTKVLIIEKSHKEQLAKLNLDRNLETNSLKAIYENKLNSTTRNWSDRVRLESAKGLPISASDTSGYTEGERECYANYTTLEKACIITTIDFNALRAWGGVVCETVECK